MYGKEQIIEEMKRIAATRGGTLSEKDFQQNSTIPISTLRFHMGSWQRALKEAGLKAPEKVPAAPKSDDELLTELIRLYKDSGELPTPALIETKGKYKTRYYLERWKSIAEAFQTAKDKFPGELESPVKIKDILKKEPKELVPEIKEEPKELVPEMKEEPIELVPEMKEEPQELVPEIKKEHKEQREQTFEKEMPIPAVSEVTTLKGEDEMNNHQGLKAERIKFIPQTIKPQKERVKPRVSIEPIDFRGLRFAPANRQGVIYLFGMICEELGFIIESFISEFPDCEGKRCVDQENNQWEPLKIQFEYKSSDFKTRTNTKGYDQTLCDLIVCWNHNWEESSIEVLELRSILQYLE